MFYLSRDSEGEVVYFVEVNFRTKKVLIYSFLEIDSGEKTSKVTDTSIGKKEKDDYIIGKIRIVPFCIFKFKKVHFGEPLLKNLSKDFASNFDDNGDIIFEHSYLFEINKRKFIVVSDKIRVLELKKEEKLTNFVISEKDYKIVTNLREISPNDDVFTENFGTVLKFY